MDQSKEQFEEHTREIGNWLIIPYGDTRLKAIKECHKIIGIPVLTIYRSSDGKIIRHNARQEVFMQGAAAYQEWLNEC
jgi:hypothetical protein